MGPITRVYIGFSSAQTHHNPDAPVRSYRVSRPLLYPSTVAHDAREGHYVKATSPAEAAALIRERLSEGRDRPLSENVFDVSGN